MARILLIFIIHFFCSTIYGFWESTSGPKRNDTLLSITRLASNGKSLFAGTDKYGIYCFDSDSSKWHSLSAIQDTVISLYVYNSYLFVGYRNEGLYRSADSGKTWVNISQKILADYPDGKINVTVGDRTTHLISTNNYLFAASFGSSVGGIFRSSNSGLTWERSDFGIPNFRYTQTIVSIGNDLFAGTAYGIYKSTNENSWTSASSGFNSITQQIKSMHVAKTILYASNVDASCARSTDFAASWEMLSPRKSGYGLPANCWENYDSVIFAGTDLGVFRSADYGRTWSEINDSLPPSKNINGMVFHDSALYVGTKKKYADQSAAGVWKLSNFMFTPTTSIKNKVALKTERFNIISQYNSQLLLNALSTGVTEINIYSLHGKALVNLKIDCIKNKKHSLPAHLSTGYYIFHIRTSNINTSIQHFVY